jgi:alpha-aminoadipic semialdehyde synthase
MSNEQLATALHLAKSVGLGRMASIGDISCDIEVTSHFFSARHMSDAYMVLF